MENIVCGVVCVVILVFIMGTHFYLKLDKYRWIVEQLWKRIAPAVDKWAEQTYEIAQRSKLDVCAENVIQEYQNSRRCKRLNEKIHCLNQIQSAYEQSEEMVNEGDSDPDRCQLCLEINHSNGYLNEKIREWNAALERAPERWIAKLFKYVSHEQLSDLT